MIEPNFIHRSVGSRIKIVFGLLLILAFAFIAAKYTSLSVRVAFAGDQVAIFEAMKASADKAADPQVVSGKLKYVVNYYPSGTKQIKGTELDRIVESARSNVIVSIIARLRDMTGKEFGSEAEKWLGEYPPRQ